MLSRIANRNMPELAAKDFSGITRYFKLLNIAYMGIRKLHTDQRGVAKIDSGIKAGTILYVPDDQAFIVSFLTIDYYKGKPIRFDFDLIGCNNTVTISRPVVTTNSQGRVIGQTPQVIHTDVPVKVGTVLQRIVSELDDTYSQFGMLISSDFAIKKGDMLTFSKHYEPAKIEGIKFNYDGIYEVVFDEEPRWI